MGFKKKLKGLAAIWLAAVVVLFVPLHVIADGESGIGWRYSIEQPTGSVGISGTFISSTSASITPRNLSEYKEIKQSISSSKGDGYGAVGWTLWSGDATTNTYAQIGTYGAQDSVTAVTPSGYYYIQPVVGALPVDVEITLSTTGTDTGSSETYFQGTPNVAVKAWYNDCGDKSEIESPAYQYCVTAGNASPETWETGSPVCTAGEDGEYTLHVKAQKVDGNWSETVNAQFVIDTLAPVIRDPSGNEVGENAEFASDAPVSITVEEAHLKEVKLDGTAVSSPYQIPADGQQHVIEATDMAGNTISRNITVTPESQQQAIEGSGVYTLEAGVPYQLEPGQWKIAGDAMVYEGGRKFYVDTSGEYEFVKQ